MFNHLRALSLALALLCTALPCHASRWIEIGNAGVSTDKVLLDADSIEKLDNFRLANVMTLSSAPQTNVNNITYDRRVRKVAFNCGDRTLQSVQVIAYLGEKRVGASPENTNWRTSMKPVGADAMNNRLDHGVRRHRVGDRAGCGEAQVRQWLGHRGGWRRRHPHREPRG